MSSTNQALVQRTFLGHPLGLYVLFFTEMWERFSYYGMRALLILYMTQYFRWSQKDASTIYKVYTSFVYVTPILGGFLADRYLGNRTAVIIGATLMAIGHFLMAFEEFPIFLSALIFLILGNGMFKPNMSTQVGRLYPPNDGRRDSAYTIFYMGINLGAFLAPLVCGWLKDNTIGEFHSGFTMAGIGMVIGLVIYLLGQPLIQELETNQPELLKTVSNLECATAARTKDRPLSETEAANTPSVLGSFSNITTMLLYILTAVLIVYAPVYYFLKPPSERTSAFWDSMMLVIAGGSLGLVAFICGQVRNALRDRVLAILILGVFVMFFWAAFEQAGNVLNLWAENNTNRYLWKPMAKWSAIPEVQELKRLDHIEEPVRSSLLQRFSSMFQLKSNKNKSANTWSEYFEDFFNPISTESFQSINALAIFVIAPFFAMMWIWLDRRGLQPSIALKMFFGLVFMMLSVAVMIEAARQEDRSTILKYANQLPPQLSTDSKGLIGIKDSEGHFEAVHAGRLIYKSDTLIVQGVLPLTERDNILGFTAPDTFKKAVGDLAQMSKTISGDIKSVSITLTDIPPGFDIRFSGLKRNEIRWNSDTKTITAFEILKQREIKGLLTSAAEPGFRNALSDLFERSGDSRVSGWWLFWAYILATLGELCLSPVGLSMVNKLAPKQYSTMLMGVWLLTSAFGNFAAGAAGEVWGIVAPITFFFWLTIIVGVAAFVLLGLVRLLVRMMHGVK